MRTAALYLRSSKDRSDVSIAAQRRALVELAQAKGLPVVVEYIDAVESGKDEDRAGFQRLLRDLKARGRHWSVLLAYDTSRIARRRYIAQALSHECKKLGVSILYAQVPEVDPISTVILESVLQAMDEVHSLMSREKGLAGMAENVRRGFRAGGRPPTGYRLERVATAVVRDGHAVMKSRLVPSDAAPAIAAYLRARAAGRHGTAAARDAGVRLSRSALVDLEWNALTYAGHTVWNMRRPKDGQSQGSRRPRSEWLIQRATHEALVGEQEAEALLTRLEASSARRTRRRGGNYLLSGILRTPGGVPWWGDRGAYHVKGGSIEAAGLEKAVLEHLATDLQRDEVVGALTAAIRRMREGAEGGREPAEKAAREALARIERWIERLTGLLEETTEPGPLLRRLEELERARQEAVGQALRAENDRNHVQALKSVTEADVRALLASLPSRLEELDRDALKDVLAGWLARIELDPATRACRVVYGLALDRVKVASPRRGGANPVIVTAMGPPFYLPKRLPGRVGLTLSRS